MPRKKSVVPDQKWVHRVAKMKRRAQVGDKRKAAKPRVRVGTKAAADLGIK